MAKRSTPTFAAVTKPILLAGGERNPMVITIGVAALLFAVSWYSWNPLPAVVSVILMTRGFFFWRSLAKRDPQMTEVAIRFWLYRSHYTARAEVRHAPR